eukprot:6925748-Pyramimonas_sp.AAC.1
MYGRGGHEPEFLVDSSSPSRRAPMLTAHLETQQVDLNSLLPLILSDRSVKLKAECYRCGGGKQCVLECCDVHVAGVSRKAFSKFGKREGVESTEHMSAMAAWAATVRATKPKVVIFENSDRFREEILHSLFKDMYAIEGLKLGGPYFGWAGKRDRYCAVMVNKDSWRTLINRISTTQTPGPSGIYKGRAVRDPRGGVHRADTCPRAPMEIWSSRPPTL